MDKKNHFRWLDAIMGILFVVAGILAFIYPATAIGGFVIGYGVLAILSGISYIVFFFQYRKEMGWGALAALIGGVLNIIFGILIMLNVGASIIGVGIIFPIWLLIYCIVRLCNLTYTKLVGGPTIFWISLIANVLGILLSILLMFNIFTSLTSVAYMIAIYFVVVGVGNILNVINKNSSGQ